MKPLFPLRLVLDGVAGGLLLFAFAYHWQGNAAHEWAGLAMLALVLVHNLFHRRWFTARSPRGRLDKALNWSLLAGMLVLLVSSLLISETVFASLRLADDFTARQIHAGIAYWLLMIVAIHLGLRWQLLMALGRRLLGNPAPHAARTIALRVAAGLLAVQGAFSAGALDLCTRLAFQMSLDWWNFEESVAPFFGHCLAVMGLLIGMTYYLTRWRR